MLLHINIWQCDIWPHMIRIRRNSQILTTHTRLVGETLEMSLSTVLEQYAPAIPWRDAVAFYLDTQEITFLVQPWQDGIASPTELRRLAHYRVAECFSQNAHPDVDQILQLEAYAWQRTALVASLQQRCWQTLIAVARRLRLRFSGVITPFQLLLQPYKKALPEMALFVCLSQQHTRIAIRRENNWLDACTLNLPNPTRTAKLEIISQLSGMKNCPCYLLDMPEDKPIITHLSGLHE